MKRKTIKTPNGFIYFLVWLLIYPLLKIVFRLKVDRGGFRLPKGPFVVVSNHQSFADFLLVMLTMYPRRLNAVTAQKFFYFRFLSVLLPVVGCIPKNLFDPDPRAIRSMLTVIKRNAGLLIFPEGRCSADGMYAGIHKSTGKLIKKLGVPVICSLTEGAYDCMPFRRKGIRAGRVYVTRRVLFTAEETRSLSVEQINAGIDAGLSGAGFQSAPKTFGTTGKRKLAQGLENILYLCPKCGSEFSLETKGNTVFCRACGNAAVMDRRTKLTPLPGSESPGTVHEWYKKQALYESGLLNENKEPAVKISVKVRMPAGVGKGLKSCGYGELLLDRSGWHYDGELSGEHVSLFFPIETVPAIPFDPNDNFQIYAKGRFFLFTPSDNPRACVKYAVMGECAHWNFAPEVRMTAGFDGGFSEGRAPSGAGQGRS